MSSLVVIPTPSLSAVYTHYKADDSGMGSALSVGFLTRDSSSTRGTGRSVWEGFILRSNLILLSSPCRTQTWSSLELSIIGKLLSKTASYSSHHKLCKNFFPCKVSCQNFLPLHCKLCLKFLTSHYKLSLNLITSHIKL
jgi:hypothetical protein